MVYSVGGLSWRWETVFHDSVMSVHVWGAQAQTCPLFRSFQGKTCLSLEQGQACFLLLMTVALNSGPLITQLPLCRVSWLSSSGSLLVTGARRGLAPTLTLLLLKVVSCPRLMTRSVVPSHSLCETVAGLPY